MEEGNHDLSKILSGSIELNESSQVTIQLLRSAARSREIRKKKKHILGVWVLDQI